jgi:hypothetical protein
LGGDVPVEEVRVEEDGLLVVAGDGDHGCEPVQAGFAPRDLAVCEDAGLGGVDIWALVGDLAVEDDREERGHSPAKRQPCRDLHREVFASHYLADQDVDFEIYGRILF